MSHLDEGDLPGDVRDVAERLRANRPEASGSELDQIKLTAMARARSSRKRGPRSMSRSLAVALTLALMAGGTAGVLAAGGGHGNGNAAITQYKPGCGPKKTNGVNPSGTHTGQPPKGPNRVDCPH